MHSSEAGTSLLLAIFTAMAITQSPPPQAPTAQPPAPTVPVSAPATPAVRRTSEVLMPVAIDVKKTDRKN